MKSPKPVSGVSSSGLSLIPKLGMRGTRSLGGRFNFVGTFSSTDGCLGPQPAAVADSVSEGASSAVRSAC
jgi:hypothetical protein